MKLMIVSDIHGYLDNTKALIKKFEMHKADKLIILGDIYHGYSYQDTNEMVNLFSKLCTKLYLLRGNCDSDYDEDISPVGLLKELVLEFNNRHIYFNHGHQGFPSVEFKQGDIYCHGHTHIPSIRELDKIIVCNPGSVSLPRGGYKASYMIIDDDGIYIYDFLDQLIINYNFEVNNEKDN